MGIWSRTVALVTANLVIFLMKPSNIGHSVGALSTGAKIAALSVFATASEVGYGAIIAVLLACGLPHRSSYKDIGAVTVVIPAIAVAVLLALGVLVPGW